MSTNPEIFKAYDIRGLYPEEINEDTAYLIGRALADFTKAKTIVVGRDMRVSSVPIEESLIQGIINQGVSVIKIGLATTPMLYFASGKLKVEAGAIITASHNPAEYNGMKFCRKKAVPIGEGSGMEEIKNLVLENKFENVVKKGSVENNTEIQGQYINHVISFINSKNQKKKIIFDFANGMGALDKKIYDNLSQYIEPRYLFDELDGSFPNHEANPLKISTLETLQKKVLEEKADFGVAMDGDGDRVGFVDENGEVVPMDYLIALLAKEILKKKPGSTILMDLRSSNAVKEYIEEAGGIVHRCRVGHSLIKKQMREDGAVFAGELSGHYFFEENFKAEIAPLAVVIILNLLNESNKNLSELAKDLKRYYHSGEINSEVEDKEKIFSELKEKYKDGKLDETDGIRIDYNDWWFNVRASNTEPKMRLNLEAKTKELMEKKRDEVLGIIRG